MNKKQVVKDWKLIEEIRELCGIMNYCIFVL